MIMRKKMPLFEFSKNVCLIPVCLELDNDNT